MGIAATVYAEELSTYGYGHPLWCPEPIQRKNGTYRHIHLGDVGFVDEDGGFRSLFNITVDAHHELNSAGVPEGFVPVDVNDNLESVRDGFLQPQPLCSETVRAHAASADASVYVIGMAQNRTLTPLRQIRNVTTVAGGNLAYTFKCSSHRGAFLVIDDHATKTSFSPNIPFKRYMLEHHASWYAFATDPKKFGLQCEPEDIILVRGTMKTSSWRIGAFFGHTSRSHGLAAGAQVAPVGGANLQMSSEYNQSHKWEQRVDPHRALPRSSAFRLASAPDDAMDVDSVDSQGLIYQPLVKDQCLFLNYYKIKWRKFLPKKIIAQADPPSLDEEAFDGGGSPVMAGTDSEVELDCDNISPHVPLDDLLDYILEHSNARVAIASDTDIEFLFQVRRFKPYTVNETTNFDTLHVGLLCTSQPGCNLARTTAEDCYR
ncbi:hypothetical protein BC629DRAFT_1541120 [Irpex lacteus]|nr:hypothetical protein BC629DRAFT_1541120 [Irpex lacteus]